MPHCAVKWCGKCSKTSSLQKDNITFHRFPQCPEIKSIWIDNTYRGENWFPSKTSVICSRHFTEDSFHNMKSRRRILESAVPTLYLPVLNSEPSTSQNTMEPDDKPVSEQSPKREVLPLFDTPSAYNCPTKKRLCRRIIELKGLVQVKNKKLKKIRECNRRLKEKVTTLKSLLEKQNSILEENINILNSLGVKCRENITISV